MSRLTQEKTTVEIMIRLYCRNVHHSSELCTACGELASYAGNRLESCSFGDKKPVCSQCRIHCYNPAMRIKIKNVMRYSGPRMILHHPLIAIQHLFTHYLK